MVGRKPIETLVSNHILDLFKKEKRTFRIMEIDTLLRKKGYIHNRSSLDDNLKRLEDQRLILKIKWRGFFRYGIPETRPNGTRFIIVKYYETPETVFELLEY